VQLRHYRKLVGHVHGILMALPDEFRTREVISGAFTTLGPDTKFSVLTDRSSFGDRPLLK
jgi:hypothetical protein